MQLSTVYQEIITFYDENLLELKVFYVKDAQKYLVSRANVRYKIQDTNLFPQIDPTLIHQIK